MTSRQALLSAALLLLCGSALAQHASALSAPGPGASAVAGPIVKARGLTITNKPWTGDFDEM
ncbi:MAG TPA: lytic transglycosylase F, partial [Caldimonas sp.]